MIADATIERPLVSCTFVVACFYTVRFVSNKRCIYAGFETGTAPCQQIGRTQFSRFSAFSTFWHGYLIYNELLEIWLMCDTTFYWYNLALIKRPRIPQYMSIKFKFARLNYLGFCALIFEWYNMSRDVSFLWRYTDKYENTKKKESIPNHEVDKFYKWLSVHFESLWMLHHEKISVNDISSFWNNKILRKTTIDLFNILK